jgi:hypothetical protein
MSIAKDTAVLLDDDTASWASWNLYAGQLARDTGARVMRISDGGITGPAFFDHVRRSRRPIINSPKGQVTPLPPDLVRRPVIAPQVYWTWSLVWRRGEERAAVLATVDALTEGSATSESTGRTPGCPTATRTSSRYPRVWQAGTRLRLPPGRKPVVA